MHAVLRAVPLALGALLASAAGTRAQSDTLPPIFTPKPAADPLNAHAVMPVSRAPVSARLRQAMTEQILAAARAFEAPAPDASTPMVPADGVLVMPRFVVKALLPRGDEVEPPVRPLLKFAPQDKWWVHQRTQPAHTATLARFFEGRGLINVSVLNGAGKGVDHPRDFTRVELGFSFRW